MYLKIILFLCKLVNKVFGNLWTITLGLFFQKGDGKSTKSLVEQAELSGKLYLKNRKIKDVKLCVVDHDLSDVTVVDCSFNSLMEVPQDVCEWFCINSLNLSHNLIKAIPDDLTALCLIEYLDLSNNLITHLPVSICELDALTSLHLQNNKIVSLPSIVGKLSNCQMLNISGNELNRLPPEIGNMVSLKHLDVSRNNLDSLPEELSQLELVYLDASCNNISTIPASYQNMQRLQVAMFDHNPLTTPPLSILKKGRVHIFKSLQSQSLKNQKQQEIMEPLFTRKRGLSKKTNSLAEVMENMYTENANKHNLTVTSNDTINTKNLSPTKDHMEVPLEKENKVVEKMTDEPTVNGAHTVIDEDFSKENIHAQNERSPKKSETECLDKVIDEISDISEEDLVTNSNPESPVKYNNKDAMEPKSQSPVKSNNQSPVKSKTASPVKINNESPVKSKTENPIQSKIKSPAKDVVKSENTDDVKDESTIQTSSSRPKNSIVRPDIPKLNLKPKPISFPGYTPAPPIKQKPKRRNPSHLHQDNPDKAHYLEIIKSRTAVISRRKHSNSESDLSFTMRRKTERIYEELELLEQLRTAIESSLKMPLPQDLLPALTDGVVLCHLANHVKSRSIPTIHVPSPAVPKLSLAKCRRNVDNFLEACAKLGVANSRLCTPNDIMQGKGLSRLVTTVEDLLKPAKESSAKTEPSFSTPSVRIAPSSFVKQKSHLYNN